MNINKHRILVVDDEMSVLFAVRTALEYRYQIFTAKNTYAAFDYLSQYNIDVLLLDIRMPDIHGLDVLEKIKKRYPDMAVIILTAYASEDDVRRAINLGVCEIIIKPFDVEELRGSVESVLS